MTLNKINLFNYFQWANKNSRFGCDNFVNGKLQSFLFIMTTGYKIFCPVYWSSNNRWIIFRYFAYDKRIWILFHPLKHTQHLVKSPITFCSNTRLLHRLNTIETPVKCHFRIVQMLAVTPHGRTSICFLLALSLTSRIIIRQY